MSSRLCKPTLGFASPPTYPWSLGTSCGNARQAAPRWPSGVVAGQFSCCVRQSMVLMSRSSMRCWPRLAHGSPLAWLWAGSCSRGATGCGLWALGCGLWAVDLCLWAMGCARGCRCGVAALLTAALRHKGGAIINSVDRIMAMHTDGAVGSQPIGLYLTRPLYV